MEKYLEMHSLITVFGIWSSVLPQQQNKIEISLYQLEEFCCGHTLRTTTLNNSKNAVDLKGDL